MTTDPTTAPRFEPRSAGFEWRDVPADRPLRRLTRDEVKAFDRDGFVIVRGAFTRDKLAEVEAAIDPIGQMPIQRS